MAARPIRFGTIDADPGRISTMVAEIIRDHPSVTAGPVMELLEIHSQMVEPVPFLTQVCDDPDDDKFLAAAIAARAHYIVSGDLALLRIKNHSGTEIVRSAKFLKMISFETPYR